MRARFGERGMSIIEALIVTAIAGLLIVLLLPLIPSSMRRDTAAARDVLTMQAAVRGERAFRGVLQGVVPQQAADMERITVLNGDPRGLEGMAFGQQDVGCLDPGEFGRVRMEIVRQGRGGSLMCRGPAHTYVMLAWAEGAADLSYSEDGVSWTRRWPLIRPTRGEEDSESVLVRFRVRANNRSIAEWIERAGWTEPPAQTQVAEAPADAAAPATEATP